MIYIGIDTGRETGFAVWDGSRLTDVRTTSIHDAIFRVLELRKAEIAGGDGVTVVIEDARQRTWLPRERTLTEYRGKLMGAGSVKRDATVWEDFCKDYGVRLIKVPPHAGLTKWTAGYFACVTGWKGRTSNHARDAAMLVFGR